DVGGLFLLQLAGLGAHVAGVGRADLPGLDARPQLGVTVLQVQRVPDQTRCRIGGPSDAGTELRGRELRDRGGAGPAPVLRLLPPGLPYLTGVEAVRVVQHGPLVRGTQEVDLRAASGLGGSVGEAEDLVLGHLVKLRSHTRFYSNIHSNVKPWDE